MTMSTEREASAIDAARSMADSLGMSGFDPQMIRSENNVVLRVTDATVIKAIESVNDDAVVKESAVISELQGSNEVVRPSQYGIGPLRADGWTAILLERLDPIAAPTTREMHESLRRLHGAMSTLEMDLVNWKDQIRRTADEWRKNPFKGEQEAVANRAFDAYVTAALGYDGPVQVLHGDAWTGQLINTADGIKWIDFESACIGPKEWDLAPHAVIDGYGPFDEDLWQTLKVVRSWGVAVWSNFNASHSPHLQSHVDFHLDLLAHALDD